MNVKEFVNLMKFNWKILFVVFSLSILIGSAANYLMVSRYEAKTDLLVNYTSENAANTILQANDIEMSLRLIETYKYMLKSDRLLERVNSQLNESYSKEELLRNVSIESGNNSQIITIVVHEKSIEKAALLANTYAVIFQEEMKTLMNLENITILNEVSETTGIKEVKIPIYMTIILTLMSSLVVSIILILLKTYYSDRLDTIFKIESVLQYPNLGVIPKMKNRRLRKRKQNLWNELLVSTHATSNLLTEEFRRMRANVQFQMEQNNAQTLMITSSKEGDGKSLVSGNLAIIMAMNGKKTIYIDGDLRKPVGRKIFDLPERKGLTSIIEGEFQLRDVVQKTDTKNLFFMSAGPIPPQPAEVLSSQKLRNLIEELKGHYDVIIFDAPPLVVADAVGLSTAVDGCLYIIDAAHTKETQARNNLAQLQKVNAPILGTILNKSEVATRKVAFE